MLVFALSCDDGLTAFFTLGEFRVLNIQVDQPEIDGTVSTPTPVNVTPYISDIDAGGRTVSLTILACKDPGVDLGIQPTCDPTSSETQTIPYASVNTSSLGTRFTGVLPAFTVNIPSGLLDNQTDQVKFNGVNYLVTIDFKAGSESTQVYKRIVVSERSTKNHNPQIKDVLVNDSASADLADQDELTISITPGFDPESYDTLDDDGKTNQKNETYITTWFSYHGTTDVSRTYLDEKATFELTPDKTNPFTVAILRDDRGGSDARLHE